MHMDLSEVYGDPRIFENPIEAGIELADMTRKRLPGLKRRSRVLSFFAISWIFAMILLIVNSGWFLLMWFLSSDPLSFWVTVTGLALFVLLLPSIGLGITLLILAVQERRFLPYLEQASMAMTALGEKPGIDVGAQKDDVEGDDDKGPFESSLAGILGSAMWAGKMVPTAGRMTTVGRAILGVILLGLGYIVVGTVLGLITGEYVLFHVILQIVVFAVFIAPAVVLFQWLSRDHDFYWYYSQRHQALEEVSSIGMPPVPDGKNHLKRFDKVLRANPILKELLGSKGGGIDKNVGRKGYRFSRYYHGTLFDRSTGILVKAMDRTPTTDDLDHLLEEADIFASKRGVHVSRVVALVTEDVEDISDEVYDHLIAQGRKTRPGECALQLVMEVDGLYSFVPYVAM
jgi:hypothetical protein